jgi:pimeloyl-ACP methyl ester carboxylesterase
MPLATSKPAYHDEVVPFTARDGFALNLVHVRGERPAPRGPVLLVHGAGVRANLFRAPVETNLVDALLAHGYDVWLENWRASIDFPPNLWTLDQAALYDHPAAVAKVVEATGWDRIKAVIHWKWG